MSIFGRARKLPGIAMAGAIVLTWSLSVPAALGDGQITAVPHDQYGTPTITIAQGQTVSFSNSDDQYHNVTAATNGSDGAPLFASQTIGNGQTAGVVGTEYLTSGSYAFFCTIHPFMRGTLVISGDGTPATRPGPSGTPSPPAQPAPSAAATTSLIATKFVRGRHGSRALNVVIGATGSISVSARLLRGRTVLGHKSAQVETAGQRTLRVRIRRSASAGLATLKLILVDSSGKRVVLKKKLRIPAARR